MLAGEAPGGFAMPREIDEGQRFTHDLLLRRCPVLADPGLPGVAGVRLVIPDAHRLDLVERLESLAQLRHPRDQSLVPLHVGLPVGIKASPVGAPRAATARRRSPEPDLAHLGHLFPHDVFDQRFRVAQAHRLGLFGHGSPSNF